MSFVVTVRLLAARVRRSPWLVCSARWQRPSAWSSATPRMSPTAPRGSRLFLVYEVYLDGAALTAHAATEAFARIWEGEVVPRLEAREATTWETYE